MVAVQLQTLSHKDDASQGSKSFSAYSKNGNATHQGSISCDSDKSCKTMVVVLISFLCFTHDAEEFLLDSFQRQIKV